MTWNYFSTLILLSNTREKLMQGKQDCTAIVINDKVQIHGQLGPKVRQIDVK